MSTLRRGFKTEANNIAREIREELGLKLIDPLDPWKLATHLDIPVVPLSDFSRDAQAARHHFFHVDRSAFSAVTVFDGSQRLIVYNDAHSRGRQTSDLAHELSHALLQHPALSALNHQGCRNWDQELEDEATWLAGALLISEEAALTIARHGLSLQKAAILYSASEQMVRFRLNVTGARIRVRRVRLHR